MSGEQTLLVIGVESRHLRRALGPSAWVVLEELLLCSVERDGERVAQVSVRAIAASAGLAKDTVAMTSRTRTPFRTDKCPPAAWES